MARRELGPAALSVARAVERALPGDALIGCSGGADSLALALGARWAAQRKGVSVEAVVVDHGLQAGSAEVAADAVRLLTAHGLTATAERVEVPQPYRGGVEAAAREARLAVLEARGLPVLLGHTLDDQAETVLLQLLRGSGTRALAGMAPVRGPFLRPLLGIRRSCTEQACREWGVEAWHDPMNHDTRFARVRARTCLRRLSAALGRDLAPALARTATLARADADFLDELTSETIGPQDGDALPVTVVEDLPEALRWRALQRWLVTRCPSLSMAHVMAVSALVDDWHGQVRVSLPGGEVSRVDGVLVWRPDAFTPPR